MVAIMEGTRSENIIPLLQKIPQRQRNKVQEITLDLAGNMGLIAKKCFPNASQVIDRFHVQQLATEALQEIRIKYRWEAIDAENQAIEDAKSSKVGYISEVLSNGDTLKQLLARSRYLLYKNEDNWTMEQKERATLLFDRYPALRKAYDLSQKLSWIFSTTKDKMYAFARLPDGMNRWNNLALNHSTPSPGLSSIITKISLTTLITKAPMLRLNLSMQKSKRSEHSTEE